MCAYFGNNYLNMFELASKVYSILNKIYYSYRINLSSD